MENLSPEEQVFEHILTVLCDIADTVGKNQKITQQADSFLKCLDLAISILPTMCCAAGMSPERGEEILRAVEEKTKERKDQCTKCP